MNDSDELALNKFEAIFSANDVARSEEEKVASLLNIERISQNVQARRDRHKPGPWEFGTRDDGSIWLSLGDSVSGAHFQGDIECSAADASLISAAPDLLEALRSIENDSGTIPQAIWDLRNAAIAKAEGRS